ncbi:carbohydrate sulfotransferase 11 [Oryzias latipes]
MLDSSLPSFQQPAPPPPLPRRSRQWYAPARMRLAPLPVLSPHQYPQEPRTLVPVRPAMKQTLSELMRMSRICRMVFATCLGSFVLVIFYFQSLFNPAMQTNHFMVDGCCKKGSRNALQELYNPLQSDLSGAAALHQARRDQVVDACRIYSASSRKRRVLTPGDLKHLVVDEDHELIYCYVPKVACTNWKRVMMVLTGRGKYTDPMKIPSNEAHIPSNLKTLNQYSIPEINHRLKNYLKFIFVREPFERLVSAYRNKFTLKYNSSFHKRFGTRIIRRYRKNAAQDALVNGDDVKFKEFIEYLVDPATQKDGPLNEHWQTVYQLCHPCHIHYDMVGKYETLEEDSNYLLQLVGVGDFLHFPSYAKSTRTTDIMTAQFFSNISSQKQIQVYQLYKLDFLMFNYSIPSYLRLD